MTAIVNPSWRIKERPCQFHQKGRCIFGEDRCNFLHTEWSPNEKTFVDTRSGVPRAAKMKMIPPMVKVMPDTPPSANDSLRSIRSPPRSPRTANLLLVLKDIIGEDEDFYEDEEVDDDEVKAEDEDEDVEEDPSSQIQGSVHEGLDSDEFPESRPIETPASHLEPPDTTSLSISDPCDNSAEISNLVDNLPPSPTHSGLLSPVEISDLQLKHLSLLSNSHYFHNKEPSHSLDSAISQDSGFYDSTTGPQWVSPTPMVLSPPRSPALTFELLSSPFGSPSTKLANNLASAGMGGLMSPKYGGAFVPRAPPSPSALSAFSGFPPEQEDEEIIPLDMTLDSPTEYRKAKARQQEEEGASVTYADMSEVAAVYEDDEYDNDDDSDDQPRSAFDDDDSDEEVEGEEIGDGTKNITEEYGEATARWDSENQETVVFLGQPPAARSRTTTSRPPSVTPVEDEMEEEVVDEQPIEEEVKFTTKRDSAGPLNPTGGWSSCVFEEAEEELVVEQAVEEEVKPTVKRDSTRPLNLTTAWSNRTFEKVKEEVVDEQAIEEVKPTTKRGSARSLNLTGGWSGGAFEEVEEEVVYEQAIEEEVKSSIERDSVRPLDPIGGRCSRAFEEIEEEVADEQAIEEEVMPTMKRDSAGPLDLIGEWGSRAFEEVEEVADEQAIKEEVKSWTRRDSARRDSARRDSARSLNLTGGWSSRASKEVEEEVVGEQATEEEVKSAMRRDGTRSLNLAGGRSNRASNEMEEEVVDGQNIEEEVKSAMKRDSARSLNLIGRWSSSSQMHEDMFSEDEPQSHSTFVVDDEDDELPAAQSEVDETAKLAYLAEDTDDIHGSFGDSFEDEDEGEAKEEDQGDDTINSLYDAYSDIDSESEVGDIGTLEQDQALHDDVVDDFDDEVGDDIGDARVYGVPTPRPPTRSPTQSLHQSPPSRSLPDSPAHSHRFSRRSQSPPAKPSTPSSVLFRERVFTPPPPLSSSSPNATRDSTPPLPSSVTPRQPVTGNLEHTSLSPKGSEMAPVHQQSAWDEPDSSATPLPPTPASIEWEPESVPSPKPKNKGKGLKPLRLSTLLVNAEPSLRTPRTPEIISPSPTSVNRPNVLIEDDEPLNESHPPSADSGSISLNYLNGRDTKRLSIASTYSSVSTAPSASSSEFSFSNHHLLSAASPLNISAHLQNAIVHDNDPSPHTQSHAHAHAPYASHAHPIDSAPPAVARTSQIFQSESSIPVTRPASANSYRFSSSSISRTQTSGIMENGRRKSTIYYIKDNDEQHIIPPQSAPVAPPANWGLSDKTNNRIASASGTRDSILSLSSVGSRSSRVSRPISRPSSTLYPIALEEDWTIRAETVATVPSPSKDAVTTVRQSIRESRQLQIQTHFQNQVIQTPPRSAPGAAFSSASLIQAGLGSQSSSRTSSSRTSSPVAQDRPATPRPPALLFALASDNPDEVRRVLENDGNNNDTTTANAGSDQSTVDANGTIGPNAQSALEFTLTNEGLKNKLDIVKVLLGYGADPAKAGLGPQGQTDGQDVKSTIEMDDATRYYISRADAQLTRRTAALMQRSVFRPLARARYRLVGQDRALEQLFRMLSMYSEKISSNPVVVFLCGPSGHGKSLLAHQFGSLLDIPTHTVNMTTLRSADDLWRSYSISSSDDSTPCTLVEFLANNEGKRCVVVLDEIEKTADLKALWTLLVPWELGRCTFEANSRTIDVKNVVWVGTSNVGHDLVFEHHQSRANQEEIMSREEYVDLMGIVRSRVSDELGASILSRVSAILPFVPFISEEKKAMASEFLQHQCIAAGLDEFLTKEKREKIIDDAMGQYVPSEGARSLYRAVSNLLVDSIDF